MDYTLCLSFLRFIGHLISTNGLREVLETIYGSYTVAHKLFGSAIPRAIWGLLIVSGVLYTTITSDIYNYPCKDTLVEPRMKNI